MTSAEWLELHCFDHPEDECLEWPFAIDTAGYGALRSGGKKVNAPRLILELLGHNMKGLVARHTCDNRSCVNAKHIIPGTRMDNYRDMVERGTPPSPPNGMSVLPSDVPVIRDYLSIGLSCRQIGDRYGVTESAVSQIKHGLTWRGV